ncbi:hypothetical protein [Kocuria sp. HSID16901]|uniref:hypothetical protein n=1 Tax=Kocuria sp. HSID16901 TaxID=2419505 RepID=UPI001EE98473|nr:hypothetical protein [Kocuria sp. HSID16901]
MTSRSSQGRATGDSPLDSGHPEPQSSEAPGFAGFAVVAAILAAISVVSGVVMLILKWVGMHPWNILTMLPMMLLPLAFILLMVALFLAARRRRTQ